MTKKYNSVCMIAFTLHHDEEDPFLTPLTQVRAALMRRIIDIDEHEEWGEAVGFEDTVENQPAPTGTAGS